MHLTDDQLNEYLDNEIAERVQVESHLASCADCAARLTALRTLFAELDSLPELELTHSLASRFTSTGQLTLQLPRWLTLTAISQAAFALIALILAAPFMMNLLPAVETPSFTDLFFQLQSQWIAWFDVLSTFHFPAIPQLPPIELSTFALTLTLIGASLLWLVGNGLLLRRQFK